MGKRDRRGKRVRDALVLSTRWDDLTQIPRVTLSTEYRPWVTRGEGMTQVTAKSYFSLYLALVRPLTESEIRRFGLCPEDNSHKI